jgi:hypothetical protein
LTDKDYFDSSVYKGNFEVLKNSSLFEECSNNLITALSPSLSESQSNFQLLYGKHGFFRLSKLFFQGIEKNDFSPHYEKYRLYKVKLPEPYKTILKLYLHLKHSSDPVKTFSLLTKLNELSIENPSILPSFPSFQANLILQSLISSEIPSSENLQLKGGHLLKILKKIQKHSKIVSFKTSKKTLLLTPDNSSNK